LGRADDRPHSDFVAALRPAMWQICNNPGAAAETLIRINPSL